MRRKTRTLNAKTIAAAKRGNVAAMEKILDYFRPKLVKKATLTMYSVYGKRSCSMKIEKCPLLLHKTVLLAAESALLLKNINIPPGFLIILFKGAVALREKMRQPLFDIEISHNTRAVALAEKFSQATAPFFVIRSKLINSHIKREGELSKDTSVEIFGRSKNKASRPPQYYNLDVIISVGYRVKSQRGVDFRQDNFVEYNTRIIKRNKKELFKNDIIF